MRHGLRWRRRVRHTCWWPARREPPPTTVELDVHGAQAAPLLARLLAQAQPPVRGSVLAVDAHAAVLAPAVGARGAAAHPTRVLAVALLRAVRRPPTTVSGWLSSEPDAEGQRAECACDPRYTYLNCYGNAGFSMSSFLSRDQEETLRTELGSRVLDALTNSL